MTQLYYIFQFFSIFWNAPLDGGGGGWLVLLATFPESEEFFDSSLVSFVSDVLLLPNLSVALLTNAALYAMNVKNEKKSIILEYSVK